MSGPHSAPGCGKSSTCDRASQVVVGVSVAAGKVWAGELEDGANLVCGCPLRQQLPGDPEIQDTPVRLRKAFGNPPSPHPTLIDLGGLGDGDQWREGILQPAGAGARLAETTALRRCWQRCVQQSISVVSQPRMGVDDLHPGSVAAGCEPLGLLIGKSSQPAQMTPVGTGQVPSIDAGQLLASGSRHGGFQRGGAEMNPSLKMARAGLEYDAGVVSVGPHALDDGRVGVVEIDQDVAGISPLGVGLKVDVTTLAVTHTQKSHCGGVTQLSGRPKPFPRKRPSGDVVNQTDQIKFVGHRRELTADGLQSDKESMVEHGPNSAIEVGSCTMDFQRAVSSVLTDCLSRRAHPTSPLLVNM